MARRKVSEDTIANEIYARFGDYGLRKKWHDYVHSAVDRKEKNVTAYIINCEPELSEWLESLIPYIPYDSVIDDVIKSYFHEEFYRKNVV